MQQFQQSSTTTKVIIIGLLVAIVGVFICACAGLGWFFLFRPTDVTGPVTTATPLPPQPTAVLPPVEFQGWRGEYFNNTNLAGEPVLIRDDERVNFDWGTNPPAPEVPADNFSVRWTISREVPAGIYRFTGTFDNGIRLWIDENLIADKWVAAPVRTGSVDVNLAAGSHTVRLEYFHGSGSAVAQLRVEYLENYPDWKAEYFAQPDFSSPPAVVRNELEINYNWGATSPIPGTIPDNNYAVRWSRGAEFDTGNYLFRAEVEGGVRVYLNNQILIDSWGESALRSVEGTARLSRGQHGLKVEYWKQTGNGQIHFAWAKLQEPNQPPLAVINGASNAVVGQTVSFNGRSSSVAEGSQLVAYDWDFGDGAKASGVDVSHVYNSPGTFAVTLTVVDDKGLTDSTVHQIQIDDRPATPQPDQPPIPVIDAPSQARVGDTITFDSSRSISANPIVRNVWEFGDGARVDNAVKAQHAYGQVGVYRVKLTVEDDQGLKSEAYHQIEIREVQPEPTPEPDQPPTARINAPAAVKVGESFIVNAADSGCATTCVSYAWDMGDGSQANAVTFQHVYQSPGDFNIVLTVTDDKGLQGTANQLINVTAQPPPEQPQPPAAVINGPTLAAVGQPVSFSSGSQPGSGGPIVEYVWDFGDGNQDNSGPAVTYTYTSPGTFTVRLTVADRQGQSDTAEWPIQISAAVEPPPQPTDELRPGQLPAPLPEQTPEGESQ
jgi:PKD repeat protein